MQRCCFFLTYKLQITPKSPPQRPLLFFVGLGNRGSLKVSTWSLGRRGILSDFKNVNIFIVLCMQDTHELLTVTYGLPVWASYAIFGVLTVLVGILLGVVSCSLERVRLNTVIDI